MSAEENGAAPDDEQDEMAAEWAAALMAPSAASPRAVSR